MYVCVCVCVSSVLGGLVAILGGPEASAVLWLPTGAHYWPGKECEAGNEDGIGMPLGGLSYCTFPLSLDLSLSVPLCAIGHGFPFHVKQVTRIGTGMPLGGLSCYTFPLSLDLSLSVCAIGYGFPFHPASLPSCAVISNF
jgi:hypothetical protein